VLGLCSLRATILLCFLLRAKPEALQALRVVRQALSDSTGVLCAVMTMQSCIRDARYTSSSVTYSVNAYLFV
jgi:hypothetical protein